MYLLQINFKDQMLLWLRQNNGQEMQKQKLKSLKVKSLAFSFSMQAERHISKYPITLSTLLMH